MKKTLVWAFVLLLLAAPLIRAAESGDWSNWRSDAPCGRSLPVKAVQTPGCLLAYAAALPDGTEFSVCQTGSTETEMGMMATLRLTLTRGGQTIEEWQTTSDPQDMKYPNAVRVDLLDLNKDGKEDALIAIEHMMLYRPTTTYWSVWVYDGASLSEPIKAENYGTLSFPVCARRGGDRFLLVAHWVDGWEHRRGHGTYLAACRVNPLDHDHGWPNNLQPVIYRRMLNRFELKAVTADAPYPWYRSLAARAQEGPLSCGERR